VVVSTGEKEKERATGAGMRRLVLSTLILLLVVPTLVAASRTGAARSDADVVFSDANRNNQKRAGEHD
jgi:hypothetical protein